MSDILGLVITDQTVTRRDILKNFESMTYFMDGTSIHHIVPIYHFKVLTILCLLPSRLILWMPEKEYCSIDLALVLASFLSCILRSVVMMGR